MKIAQSGYSLFSAKPEHELQLHVIALIWRFLIRTSEFQHDHMLQAEALTWYPGEDLGSSGPGQIQGFSFGMQAPVVRVL